jgi:hypothetical protein
LLRTGGRFSEKSRGFGRVTTFGKNKKGKAYWYIGHHAKKNSAVKWQS